MSQLPFTLWVSSSLGHPEIEDNLVRYSAPNIVKFDPETVIRVDTGMKLTKCTEDGSVMVTIHPDYQNELIISQNIFPRYYKDVFQVVILNRSSKFIRIPTDVKLFAYSWVPSYIPEESTTHSMPTEVPIEEATVQSMPTEVPIEEAPIEEVPIEEVPIEEATIEEASIEEATIEEATIEEAINETPNEEAEAATNTISVSSNSEEDTTLNVETTSAANSIEDKQATINDVTMEVPIDSSEDNSAKKQEVPASKVVAAPKRKVSKKKVVRA